MRSSVVSRTERRETSRCFHAVDEETDIYRGWDLPESTNSLVLHGGVGGGRLSTF